MPDAVLVLEDGRAFYGRRFGARGEAGGEVVFNTAMTGYPEILSDPSYSRQLVALTYPMIGNYGIAEADLESSRAHAAALIVRESSLASCNWRQDLTLDAYLQQQGVPGLLGVDTRALVRHLRDRGAQRGLIADAQEDLAPLLARARAVPSMQGADLASQVSTTRAYAWVEGSPSLDGGVLAAAVEPAAAVQRDRRPHVAVLDYGVKRNILRRLVDCGCNVTVLPAHTAAVDILAQGFAGVVLSNGPGDPEPCKAAIACIRGLLGRLPLFGICLGHQLLCLAVGAKSFKLPFGHRGGNHPVMDLESRRVLITAQNHGFAIDPDSLPATALVTHVSLNDRTLEGIRLTDVAAFSVQFHPEGAPGPSDAAYLFDRFIALLPA